MSDVQSILEQLSEFRGHLEYDQEGTFRLVRSIVDVCNDFHDKGFSYEAFIWKLLVTAHTNGQREAAGYLFTQAQNIDDCAAMVATLHLPGWPTAKDADQ